VTKGTAAAKECGVPLVSFAIPTLREDEIGASLTRLSEALSRVPGYEFELLLVDDSPEPYKRIMDEAIVAHDARYGPKVIDKRVDGPRKGKGAGVREGVRASRGDVVFTMDADLPVPLENVERFLRFFEQGYEVVVAERPFDRNLAKPVRFVASRVLFALQRAVVFQSRAFLDTQCGFKAFRGDMARAFAREQIVDGGMVDIEYLYAATCVKARVKRVEVTPMPETRESKINVKKAMFQDPVDLVRIKVHGLTGGYRAKR
jgi:glycosyltransferase involved in cell wall biosynthesis